MNLFRQEKAIKYGRWTESPWQIIKCTAENNGYEHYESICLASHFGHQYWRGKTKAMVDEIDKDTGAAADVAEEDPAPGNVVDGASRCPTELYFLENGQSFKVLVALCRGLKDEDGKTVLEPDTDPFWKSLRVFSRRPTADGWHVEISRRWNIFVNARIRPNPYDQRLGPRPKQWKLQKVLDWLDNNPIEATEDVAFLVATATRYKEEERKRRIEDEAVEAAEKSKAVSELKKAEAVDGGATEADGDDADAASPALVEKRKRKRAAAAVYGKQPPKENNGSSSSSKQLRKDAIIRAPHSTLLPPQQLHSIVSAWLQDDVPSHFDVGGYVVGLAIQRAELWMKSPGTLSGIPFFDAVFAACGECTVRWEDCAVEGESFDVGRSGKVKLATVTGPVSHLLRGERTALNSLSRCSGVATLSSECVRIARSRGWAGEVAGTRKTTPGFRLVEKYGLLVGGASTHRLDLSQMVMLKDNHIWSCGGSIEAAVKKARGVSGFSQKIEVECQSLEEALIAAEAGADVVMLDNFAPDRLRADAKAFKESYPHVKVEASGGITIETMADYFSEHVDVISQGALTQGYDCVDFSLKIIH